MENFIYTENVDQNSMINYAEMRKEHKRILEKERLEFMQRYSGLQKIWEVDTKPAEIQKSPFNKNTKIPREGNKNVVHKYVVPTDSRNFSFNKNAECSSKYTKKFCGFCRCNGEDPAYYGSHVTRDENNIIVCPILRKHVCEICQATGDNAHTILHCPYIYNKQKSLQVDMRTMIKVSKTKNKGQIKKLNNFC